MNDVGSYYDRLGFIYEPLWGTNIHWGIFRDGDERLPQATERYTQWACELLAPEAGNMIIDLGIGPGHTARHLITHYGVSVIGTDVSTYQLDRARRDSNEFVQDGRLHLTQANIEAKPLGIGPADGAISQASFFHLHDRRQAFLNVAAVLKKGARFVVDDLIIGEKALKKNIDTAFGRFGAFHLETAPSYAELIDRSPFSLNAAYDITSDLASTYDRVIENLKMWRESGDARLKKEMYASLLGSFQMIRDMAQQRKLLCVVRVLISQ